MDILRDAITKGLGKQVTGGQAKEERGVESESGVVSKLDPKAFPYSSFVHHRNSHNRKRPKWTS